MLYHQSKDMGTYLKKIRKAKCPERDSNTRPPDFSGDLDARLKIPYESGAPTN